MMYDKLIRQLRNCAIESAPCKACDMVNDESCTDGLKKHTVDTQEFVILNEYDEIISYDDFIRLVEDKQHDEHCLSNTDNFAYARNVDGYRFSDGEFC